MELTFLGLGGAFNCQLGNNMAMLKNGKKLLLVDCGEGCLKELQKLNVFKDIDTIYVAITHNHADHIAGLANVIWYSKLKYKNIDIFIIQNTPTHSQSLGIFLDMVGVSRSYYNFIDYKDFKMGDLILTPMPTTHAKNMECFGFMFQDNGGKYYYTGDTNDIKTIEKYTKDPQIKIIYTEICEALLPGFTNSSHILYDQLKMLDKTKLRLMHFSSEGDFHIRMQKEGFIIPKNVIL